MGKDNYVWYLDYVIPGYKTNGDDFRYQNMGSSQCSTLFLIISLIGLNKSFVIVNKSRLNKHSWAGSFILKYYFKGVKKG